MINKIYAFVGPHAAGKSFLLSKLRAIGLHYIPAYTTRAARKGERDGDFYYYVNKIDFFKLDLIEKVTYKGEYYGLKKEDVLTALHSHSIIMIQVDGNGLKQLNKLLKDRIESIYIMSDYVSMVERMLKMGETNDDIKHNLEYAENNNEFNLWKSTTHVVKNVTDYQVALSQILSIMNLTILSPNIDLTKL
ncbi:MAG: guanylate kinase [Selenomonadaceae bacterium]